MADTPQQPTPPADPDDPLEARREAVLDAAIGALGELFDTVQIVTTIVIDTGKTQYTKCLGDGCGNIYARVESCREFLSRNDERLRKKVWREKD